MILPQYFIGGMMPVELVLCNRGEHSVCYSRSNCLSHKLVAVGLGGHALRIGKRRAGRAGDAALLQHRGSESGERVMERPAGST